MHWGCYTFKEGTGDYEWFNMDAKAARKYKEANTWQQPKASSANEADGPCFDIEPKLQRPTNISRPLYDTSPIAFVDPLVSPVHVRVQYGHTEAALYDRLVKIVEDSRGFHASLQNFHASLKPQAKIDSKIMTLYLKTFNLEQMYNRKKPKKFAFCVFMGLGCVPSQLFIVVIENKHWVVVVVNLMHKQFNISDSLKNPKDVTLLENANNNVTCIPNLRKRIAGNLLKHPTNNFDPPQ
ncbi:hypothetical protein D1007_43439 [Hordeum vulgare]|nr:hypothetical protein D1007_43439 [Hordeum vulgare]